MRVADRSCFNSGAETFIRRLGVRESWVGDRAFNAKTYLRANERYRSFLVGLIEIGQLRWRDRYQNHDARVVIRFRFDFPSRTMLGVVQVSQCEACPRSIQLHDSRGMRTLIFHRYPLWRILSKRSSALDKQCPFLCAITIGLAPLSLVLARSIGRRGKGTNAS